MSPFQYVRAELSAGRFASMPALDVAGSVYLCDADWRILPGSKSYTSKAAALADASRIRDRASKAHYRAVRS